MKRISYLLLLFSALPHLVNGAGQSHPQPDDAMLAANQKVMTVLMRQLEQEPDIRVRRTLILDHMTHMDTYTSHLVSLYDTAADRKRQEHIKSLFQQALLRSVSLLNSGVSDNHTASLQSAESEAYLTQMEQRIQLLNSMMTQTTRLQTLMNQPDAKH